MRYPPRLAPPTAPPSAGRRALRAAALTIATLLTGCSMQANPVCIGPGPEGMQITPMYQCEEGMHERAIINR